MLLFELLPIPVMILFEAMNSPTMLNVIKSNCLVFFICAFSVCANVSALPEKIIGALPQNSWGKHDPYGQSGRILKAISHDLGTNLELFNCPWARCIKSLENGDADIMVSLYYSKERANYMLFISPEVKKESHQFVFYEHPDQKFKVTSLDSLRGRVVGVVRGNIYFEEFDEAPDIQKVQGRMIRNLVDLLNKKRIDTFIDSPINKEANLREYQPFQALTQSQYTHDVEIKEYIVISKISPWRHFEQELSSTVKKLVDSGEIDAIFKMGL